MRIVNSEFNSANAYSKTAVTRRTFNLIRYDKNESLSHCLAIESVKIKARNSG